MNVYEEVEVESIRDTSSFSISILSSPPVMVPCGSIA